MAVNIEKMKSLNDIITDTTAELSSADKKLSGLLKPIGKAKKHRSDLSGSKWQWQVGESFSANLRECMGFIKNIYKNIKEQRLGDDSDADLDDDLVDDWVIDLVDELDDYFKPQQQLASTDADNLATQMSTPMLNVSSFFITEERSCDF